MTTIYEGLRPLKLLGSLLEVVRIFFRKDGKKIEWKPNQSHTYAADMTYEFPAPDTATTESDILVSEKSEQTLKNKTINFNPLVGGNTAQDIPLSAMKTDNTQSGKVVMRDGSGVMTNGLITSSHLDATLSSTISGKAEQSDLEAVEDDVAVLQSAVAAKASNNTVSALEDRVEVLEAGGGGAALESVNTDWVTADGTSKTVSHSLGTDVQVQIFDKSNGQMLFVDTIEVTATTVVLTASQAPGASGWRVTVQKN